MPAKIYTNIGFENHLKTQHGSDLVSLLDQQQTLPQVSGTLTMQTKNEKQGPQECQESNKSYEHNSTTCKQANVKLIHHQCQKYCRTNPKLQLHINTVHKKLTPYECHKCQRTFGQKSNLQNHINSVHEKIKPFKCHKCDWAFGCKASLQRHIRVVHEKIKPFQCQKCERAFGVNCNLQSHVKFFHEKLTAYQCQECKRTFTSKSAYQYHINHVHKSDIYKSGKNSGGNLEQNPT